MATAGVADFGSFDVILPVGLQKSKRGEPLYELRTCLWPRKTLQELLQNEAGREDLVCTFQCVPQRPDFRRQYLGIATEGKRPDAGIDEQAHGWRAQSTL